MLRCLSVKTVWFVHLWLININLASVIPHCICIYKGYVRRGIVCDVNSCFWGVLKAVESLKIVELNIFGLLILVHILKGNWPSVVSTMGICPLPYAYQLYSSPERVFTFLGVFSMRADWDEFLANSGRSVLRISDRFSDVPGLW